MAAAPGPGAGTWVLGRRAALGGKPTGQPGSSRARDTGGWRAREGGGSAGSRLRQLGTAPACRVRRLSGKTAEVVPGRLWLRVDSRTHRGALTDPPHSPLRGDIEDMHRKSLLVGEDESAGIHDAYAD